MTESNNPTPEPLEVPLQEPPVTQEAVPVAAKTNHTRTILEVVGGVVAIALIGAGTIFGFVVGRVSADDHVRDQARVSFEQGRGQQGLPGQQGPGMMGNGQQGLPGQPGQGQGPGMMGGQRGQGVDPDGDNWTGQNHMGGQPGQGVDPDGDNWTGQNRDGGQGQTPVPVPSQSSQTG